MNGYPKECPDCRRAIRSNGQRLCTCGGFDEWWKSTYGGSFGGLIIEAVFKDVAEKAYYAAYYLANQIKSGEKSEDI